MDLRRNVLVLLDGLGSNWRGGTFQRNFREWFNGAEKKNKASPDGRQHQSHVVMTSYLRRQVILPVSDDPIAPSQLGSGALQLQHAPAAAVSLQRNVIYWQTSLKGSKNKLKNKQTFSKMAYFATWKSSGNFGTSESSSVKILRNETKQIWIRNINPKKTTFFY